MCSYIELDPKPNQSTQFRILLHFPFDENTRNWKIQQSIFQVRADDFLN